MGVIPAAVGTLSGYYPRRDKSIPPCINIRTSDEGTTRHPVLLADESRVEHVRIPIPANSYRRQNTPLTMNGTVYYYILATDEWEKFLVDYCRG